MFWMLMTSLLAALGGLILYIYFWCHGQFEEDELVKYQLFREENPDE